jgi:N-methylhydantoinase B
MPIHIGSLHWGVRALLAKYRLADICPGDAFVCNDPYLAGGTHLPDISILTPVFIGDEIRFFTGNIAHHADVGGPVAGSVSGQSRSIFSEGIRLPLIRIQRAGIVDEDLIELIAENTREPIDRMLDLKTQIGANEKGAALLRAVISEYGLDTVETAIDDLLLYTRRRIATAIRDLPDGTYRSERFLDDDGVGDEPVVLAVEVTIAGDRLSFDFTGSGAEAAGAVNLSASSLEATLSYCVKALLDPEVPSNNGLLESFQAHAPPGTIVSPRPPAAVAARAVTSNRLAGAVFDALQHCLPEDRRMAANNDSTSLVAVSGWDDTLGRRFVYPESIGGGAGAFPDQDGIDAIHVHTVNSTNLPVEALEIEYPLFCRSYALVPDSGGAGRQRGGLGIEREIVALADGMSVTVRSDGHRFAAPGAAGGLEGSTTRITKIFADGREEAVASKCTLELARGDGIRVRTLGGGGFGDPHLRDGAALRDDLRSGKVTPKACLSDYGEDLAAQAMQDD